MSLFGALSNAVSGLSAQEASISNISANIANSQTVGYKAVDTSFATLVDYNQSTAVQQAGVLASPDYTNDVSGPIIQSQQATSLAINGNGFFQVKAPAVTSGGTTSFDAANAYTRRGDFTPDKNGYLVNGAGYTLEGFPVNSSTGKVSGTTPAPIQVPQRQSSPQATSLASLVANLPSNYPVQGTSGYNSPSPVTTQIYDAQGSAHTVSIQFDKTATNTWNATITAADTTSAPTTTSLALKFGDGTNGKTAGSLTSVTGTGVTGDTVALPLTYGGAAQTVSLDLTGLTQYSGSSVSVTSQAQNGYTAGSLQSTSIDADGFVTAAYSNGETVKVAQVAITQFAAPDELNVASGDAFTESAASGTPTIGTPGANGAGTVSGSTLEQSNVNLSTELTKLIAAQQAYSSNARVITTTNQMVQTLNSLIQG